MFASREGAATAEDTGCAVGDILLGCSWAEEVEGPFAAEGCIVSGDGNGPLVLADNGGNEPLPRVGEAVSGPLFIAGDDGVPLA